MKKIIKKSAVGFLIAVLAGGLLLSARAETTSDTVTVQMTVPASSNCGNGTVDAGEACDAGAGNGICPATCSTSCTLNNCSPGGPGADVAPPVISNVSSNPGYTTSSVSWKAEDNVGVSACTFNYGLDNNYGQSAVPITADGLNFSVNLSGLTQGMPYYFSISCRDAANNSAAAAGNFTTLTTELPVITTNLTVKAKPEKRVDKAGGNYAFIGTLLLYNPANQRIVYEVSVQFSAAGIATLTNVSVPSGSALHAYLKGESHLAKKITGVDIVPTIVPGQANVLDFTDSDSFYLLAGDLAGNIEAGGATGDLLSFLQSVNRDDFVDILDISAVVARFNNGESDRGNLNGDTIVDAQDISMVLSNWNKKGNLVLE